MYKVFYVLIICCLTFSCVEDFDLTIPANQSKLVVDALITDQPGPYYVRLTKSKAGIITLNEKMSTDSNYWEKDFSESVTNALVIMSDDAGTIDTLIHAPLNNTSYFKFTNINTRQEDSVLTVSENFQSIKYGFYNTTKIKGMAGRTYNLHIEYNNKIYTSSTIMAEAPEIDSVGIKIIPNPIKVKGDFSIPTVSFHQPKGQKNYYMFQLYDGGYIARAYSLWQFSIIDGLHLPENVVGLNINEGFNANGVSNPFPYLVSGGDCFVKISSLTETSYLYYKALIAQFYNDGGAYNPAPYSPKGNINNDALGLFRASAITTKSNISNAE